MRPFESITELGVYLRLLTDIRDTLDRFLPVVFDRSLSELIAATASRKDSPQMSGSNRRRLRRLAGEYVRPGVHITDLHGALVDIQQQRVLWQRFVAAGVTPEVPIGIADVQVAYQQVTQDLAALDEPLDGVGIARRSCRSRICSSAWRASPPTPMCCRTCRSARNCAPCCVISDWKPCWPTSRPGMSPEEQVAAELELAWWRSALESLLESDRALLGANTSVLDRLEADFKLVDEAHAAGSAGLLGWQLAENWNIGLGGLAGRGRRTQAHPARAEA